MDVSRLLPAVARKSIVRKYGLLVLLVLVVTGLLTAAIVTGVSESVRDNRQTELQTSAIEEADQLDSYYRDQRDRAGLVSENGDFEGDTNTESIRQSLNAQRENFENEELVALHYVTESTRRIRASTLAPREGEFVRDIPWRDGFSFSNPNDIITSNVYEAPRQSVDYIAFASPVENKDGVLVVVLNATARGASLRNTAEGGFTNVVDGNGTVQFSNRRNDTLKPYPGGADARPVSAGLADDHGITTGGDDVVAYAPVDGTNLVVVKHAPKANAYALSDSVTERLSFLVAAIALGLGILVVVVYRDLVVPVSEVTTQVRRLAAGEVEAHSPGEDRIDEIGQLHDGVTETTNYLETVTDQAEAVAEQEFDADVFSEEVPGRLGEALDEMRQKLEAAIDDLEQTVQRLEASNDRLQQFAYVASHDLQEPARMVSSYMSLLESEYGDELDEEAQEYMDFAVDGADRMQAMIDGLLDYSRVETNAEEFSETDASAVFAETLTDLNLLIEERDATVTHDDLPTVHADRSQLGQLFQNLVENAIQHGGDGVHVGAQIREDAVVFSVEDNGEGIPENRQDRIFDIFEQGSRDDEGTGIGLAVCDRIVSRHGGEMWVESTEGEGTTFYFSIPS